MSSYIDHRAEPRYVRGKPPSFEVTHSWDSFTDERLRWLYGPNHAAQRAAMTARDLEAWRRLGAGFGEYPQPAIPCGKPTYPHPQKPKSRHD